MLCDTKPNINTLRGIFTKPLTNFIRVQKFASSLQLFHFVVFTKATDVNEASCGSSDFH